ncbi:MAG: SpoIIE family protein phosphatase, partial [Verrucomicrobia bacterium]|nr:SpoIIE family protein phosphatase [Verrucomicrobiota bacterium]
GEDIAVAAMKMGAHDYLMKGNLARLVPAVERELREAAERAARRQAEQDLRDSELRYRLVWETATDAVILIDTDSHIHYANPAVKDIFGYTAEEFVGQNLSCVIPEKLRPAHRQALARYLATGARKLNWRATEMTALHRDGREIPVEIAFRDMELKGQRWFVGFVRDITERKRAKRELEENEEQFRVAREIQQRLFPKQPPALDGFDLAGASYPAEATGGDYFDYLPMLKGCLGLVVGDVTGHGIGPALLMAETRAYLRILARNREDVGEILTRANRILAEDVDYERFVTVFLAKLDPQTRTLSYASAGHATGYLLDAAGTVKARLQRTGVPLGVQRQAQYSSMPPQALEPGDVLLCLTDGLEEAMSPDNRFFGSEQLLAVARANLGKPACQLVEVLYAAVRQFSRNAAQLDDITVMVAKALPAAAGVESEKG